MYLSSMGPPSLDAIDFTPLYSEMVAQILTTKKMLFFWCSVIQSWSLFWKKHLNPLTYLILFKKLQPIRDRNYRSVIFAFVWYSGVFWVCFFLSTLFVTKAVNCFCCASVLGFRFCCYCNGRFGLYPVFVQTGWWDSLRYRCVGFLDTSMTRF